MWKAAKTEEHSVLLNVLFYSRSYTYFYSNYAIMIFNKNTKIINVKNKTIYHHIYLMINMIEYHLYTLY
jgi:hypothetical protein